MPKTTEHNVWIPGDGMPCKLTVEALAEAANVTPQIMLRRIATVIQRRPWHRRIAFFYMAARQLGAGRLEAIWNAVQSA